MWEKELVKQMKKVILLIGFVLLLVACGNSGPIGKPTDVRNDATGKWKKATTSENIDIKEHALDYSKEHMKDGDTHFIIDFNKNNTYKLNLMSGTLYLDIHERVDKEEHDAETIGKGMLLKEYVISADGKVEELE